MNLLTSGAVCATVFALTACGGSNADMSGRTPPLSVFQSSMETLSITRGVSEAFNEDPALDRIDLVDSSDVPTKGRVSFNGGMFARYKAAGTYLAGQMYLNVDLGTNAVTGDIINVTELNGTETSGAGSILTGGTYQTTRAYEGTLDLTEGRLSRQGELGTAFFGAFTGDLVHEGQTSAASIALSRVDLLDVNDERTVFGFATGRITPDGETPINFEAYIAAR